MVQIHTIKLPVLIQEVVRFRMSVLHMHHLAAASRSWSLRALVQRP